MLNLDLLFLAEGAHDIVPKGSFPPKLPLKFIIHYKLNNIKLKFPEDQNKILREKSFLHFCFKPILVSCNYSNSTTFALFLSQIRKSESAFCLKGHKCKIQFWYSGIFQM